MHSADPPATGAAPSGAVERAGRNDEQQQKEVERLEDEQHARAAAEAARRKREAEPFRTKMLNEKGYALPPDRNLIRVAVQQSLERDEFYGLIGGYARDSRGKFDLRPTQLAFTSDGTSLDLCATTQPAFSFDFLIQVVFGLRGPYVDAPDRIQTSSFAGDWVVREPARHQPALLVQDFERILNEDFRANVKVSYRDVQRPVYVASGDYAHIPTIADQKPRTVRYYGERYAVDHIDLYVSERARPDQHALTMELDGFLNAVSSRIGMPIIDEIRTPPTNLIRLRENYLELRKERGFKHAPELVLPRINEQTGIEFHKANRVIKMLVIEDGGHTP